MINVSNKRVCISNQKWDIYVICSRQKMKMIKQKITTDHKKKGLKN